MNQEINVLKVIVMIYFESFILLKLHTFKASKYFVTKLDRFKKV
jgi:hypothetical protein